MQFNALSHYWDITNVHVGTCRQSNAKVTTAEQVAACVHKHCGRKWLNIQCVPLHRLHHVMVMVTVRSDKVSSLGNNTLKIHSVASLQHHPIVLVKKSQHCLGKVRGSDQYSDTMNNQTLLWHDQNYWSGVCFCKLYLCTRHLEQLVSLAFLSSTRIIQSMSEKS